MSKGHAKNSRRLRCFWRSKQMTLCGHHHFGDQNVTDDEEQVTCPRCRRILRRRRENLRREQGVGR